MDKRILLTFYAFAQVNRLFGGTVKFFYKFSSVVFFLIYYTGAVYLIFNDRQALLNYFIIPFCVLILCWVLRKIIKRKRPYEVLTKHITIPENKKTGSSFPSNHSASAAVIAFACLAIHTGIGFAVFLLAVMTGISRIAVGVHYPSDIMAGFLISAAVSIAGYSLL